MSEHVGEPAGADPIINRSERLTGVGRLLVLACGLVGAAVAFAVIQREAAEPFVLGLLGILAVVGVFTLFAGAIGLLRFAGRGQGDALSRTFMDQMGEGVVVTDRNGRIVYANRAYAALTGARGEHDVRAIERLFAGDQLASEAIYRLSRALREGRAGEEEIRTANPLGGSTGTGDGAHWHRLRVRPLSPRSGRQALAAWTLSDIGKERARQEPVFLEL